MEPSPPEGRFSRDNLLLLESGNFADAEILCIESKWMVHKIILCTRCKWFSKAFADQYQEGQTNVVNLHNHKEEDINTLLYFIYSGVLDKSWNQETRMSFTRFAKLFALGDAFELEPLCDDALNLLGVFCDDKLRQLCSYDIKMSGRNGIIDEKSDGHDQYIEELIQVIEEAYTEVRSPTRLQSLLSTFVWAGRERLLKTKEDGSNAFLSLSERCPMFGNDIFRLTMGRNLSEWLPGDAATKAAFTTIDHTHKTQHPDRCANCQECFDENLYLKAMYNPFQVVIRPAVYCKICVRENQDNLQPLWRQEPKVAPKQTDTPKPRSGKKVGHPKKNASVVSVKVKKSLSMSPALGPLNAIKPIGPASSPEAEIDFTSDSHMEPDDYSEYSDSQRTELISDYPDRGDSRISASLS
ncbi:hypothetical protein B0T26DRAFT_756801 [Lasiosphaeria miniovina]|uniref:BTB domain-containing protein n=1 Tax=Lasiosphaeria miniovina TaxID=1954250 RepID=A0AA39ZTB4_9PEZI|nr:uncharacterized protein B0T26DRAFT_756801 [Lasiosphaeria miniovina]KAK0703242.1 hypothetical protein B0T26DRAFT_756801 [Lasiosphaeria miniovina]